MNDILHRIRWPNVARAAAVLSAVALLISWPHLRGRAPELPPATAAPAEVEPVARPGGGAAKSPAPGPPARPAGKARTAARPKAKAKAPAARHRSAAVHRARRPPHRRPAPRSRPTPVPVPASAPPPTYVTPAPSPPAAAEFRP
jgi:hypothetical protein